MSTSSHQPESPRSRSASSSRGRHLKPTPSLAALPWHLVNGRARIDSFNDDQMEKRLDALRAAGEKYIAIDLRTTRFLSLPALRFIKLFSEKMKQDGGFLGLIGPTDRVMRHFEIYTTIEDIVVFPSTDGMTISNRSELEGEVSTV